MKISNIIRSETFIFNVLIFVLYENKYVQTQILDRAVFRISDDGQMTFPKLAAKYGHSAEEKRVITEDGYILTLFHIPGDKNRATLLVHGNTPTADCWISRGNISLAITLARQGYDVWAINLRGNTYSRRHIFIDPDKEPKRFFNFTFYEQGIYDLPATIDFILNETGQKQLLAIGHSVGTTQFYVLGSERPEYNNKIKLAISLAPIAFLQHLRGLASLPTALLKFLVGFMYNNKIYELASYAQVKPFIDLFCLQPIGYELCIKIAFNSIIGNDPKCIEPDFMFTFFGHFPGGASTISFFHLIQIIEQKQFAKYDYGRYKNMRVYGRPVPPKFDLSKVTMKSAIFVGAEDLLAGPDDAILLNRSLPNVVHYQVLPYPKFSHGDFVWGRKMPQLFYPYLFNVIEKYI